MNQPMAELKGARLAVPHIIDGNRSTSYKDFVDRRVKHTQPLRLRDQEWAFCYASRDTDLVNQLISSFGKAAGSLGMKFEGQPVYIEIPSN